MAEIAKKKRGRKMPKWKKWVRAGVSIFGTVIGGAVAFSPTFRGLTTMFQGDPAGGIRQVTFDVTGTDPLGGDLSIDINKVIGFGIVVGAGFGLMSLFKAFARKI